MEFWSSVYRENPWILPLLGVAGVVATFWIGGPKWGLSSLGLLLAVTIGALGNSLRIARAQLKSAATVPEADAVAPIAIPAPGDAAAVEERESDDPRAAITAKEDSDQASNGGERSHVGLGVDAAITKDYAEARKQFQHWYDEAENPDDETLRRASALWILANTGDTAALDQLVELADKNPQHPEPLRRLVAVLRDAGNSVEALNELDTRTSHIDQAEHAALLLERARTLQKLGRSDEALLQIRAVEAMTLDRSERAEVLQLKGKLLTRPLSPNPTGR